MARSSKLTTTTSLVTAGPRIFNLAVYPTFGVDKYHLWVEKDAKGVCKLVMRTHYNDDEGYVDQIDSRYTCEPGWRKSFSSSQFKGLVPLINQALTLAVEQGLITRKVLDSYSS